MTTLQKLIAGCAALEGIAMLVAWRLDWSPLGIGLVLVSGFAVTAVMVTAQRRGLK